jgi:predicted helicase
MNGFELLMASYTMAHLKLDMLLTDTGYVPTKDQRLRVFLTNSLEEPNPDSGSLFGTLLSDEADQADDVKRDTPVMCVIGNPPYSVSSNNKSAWIERLIADYKKDLNEKSYNSLSDDYVKFIRFGQYFIEKNGDGVLAFISNNSFIDGVVFRQMRKHLLESFDKIYIIDLHGNSKKKEICLDGTTDQNVFDIMQGVSINIFVKTGLKKKNELAKLYNYDLFGKREFKYDFLSKKNIDSIKWNNLNYTAPEYSFYLVNQRTKTEYNLLLNLDSLFIVKASGIQTEFDELSLHNTKQEAIDKLESIKNNSVENIIERYKFPSSKKLKIIQAKLDIESNSVSFENFGYKLFTDKIAIYTGKTNGIMGRPRYETMRHLLKPNLALITMRTQVDTVSPNTYFISNKPIDKNFYGFQTYAFPLYLYPETNGQQTIEQTLERTPNLNTEIVKQIAKKLGLTYTNEKETTKNTFAPIDILDYIYAVLHSSTYREKYKEFLKIDFPRVPYPKDQDTFWNLVKLGGEIRQIHLLESPIVEKFISKYPITGTNIVGKPKYENGKIMINETQYFEDVPEVAWNFYIGGYQPAQKWLKDRIHRELQIEDILHYLKIIVALTETDRLMKEVEKIEIE